jgi:hypothetical protein
MTKPCIRLFWWLLLVVGVFALMLTGKSQPLPTLPKAKRPAAGVTQGAGAKLLIAKVSLPTLPKTNIITLTWGVTNWVVGDQPYPGMIVYYWDELKRVVTNYGVVQMRTSLTGQWQTVWLTNRPGWFQRTTTNRSEFYRVGNWPQ